VFLKKKNVGAWTQSLIANADVQTMHTKASQCQMGRAWAINSLSLLIATHVVLITADVVRKLASACG